MMRKSIFGLAALGAMAFSSASQAAVFDFAYQADNVSPYEQGYAAYMLTDNGITVTATGSNVAGDTDYYAYLDAGAAGLGVCKVLDVKNQCSPGNDDNTTLDEKLHLSFSEQVEIAQINFVNGSHTTWFDDNQFYVSVDGGAATAYDLVGTFNTVLVGTTFDFWLVDQADNAVANQFYISSISVPAPAPLALLAIGVLAMYGASRKKA